MKRTRIMAIAGAAALALLTLGSLSGFVLRRRFVS